MIIRKGDRCSIVRPKRMQLHINEFIISNIINVITKEKRDWYHYEWSTDASLQFSFTSLRSR